MEHWKDIKGYNGKYQVSDLGRIKSLERYVTIGKNKRFVNEKILNPIKCSNGYLSINFVSNGRKQFLIHRLVAEAFFGDTIGSVINHIDLDKTNNSILNLEAITQKENIEHSILNDMNGQILLDTENGIYYIRYYEAAKAKNISLNKLYKTMANINNYNLIKV
jgi:hypothetical protein